MRFLHNIRYWVGHRLIGLQPDLNRDIFFIDRHTFSAPGSISGGTATGVDVAMQLRSFTAATSSYARRLPAEQRLRARYWSATAQVSRLHVVALDPDVGLCVLYRVLRLRLIQRTR